MLLDLEDLIEVYEVTMCEKARHMSTAQTLSISLTPRLCLDRG